jgi:hypothetical protein
MQDSEDGFVRRVYDRTLRPYLPRKIVVYDDVAVRAGRLLDFTDYEPEYKAGLLDSIRAEVGPGTDAVLIGAGRGVSSIVAARTGADVVAIEAANQMVDLARDTIELNSVDGIEVQHAIVGDPVEVYGDASDAAVVSPRSLNTGDCLIMDCEGSEKSILSGLEDWPSTIIVETHPERGVPTSETRDLLTGAGYTVRTVEYPHDWDTKKVLVGTEQ